MSNTMTDYRVYYLDGSTYDGTPELAPIFHVLVIVERDAGHGRRLVSNGDYYCWEDGHWLAVDYPGLIQYLYRPGWKRVLVGVMAESNIWNATMKRAREDVDFPIQTALHRYESRAGWER